MNSHSKRSRGFERGPSPQPSPGGRGSRVFRLAPCQNPFLASCLDPFQLHPSRTAGHFLRLPPGEGRPWHPWLSGSWSHDVFELSKTCLTTNRCVVPCPSPGRGVQTLAHGVSHGFVIDKILSPGGAIRTPCLYRPSGVSSFSRNDPWLTPWATALSALRASLLPSNLPTFQPLKPASLIHRLLFLFLAFLPLVAPAAQPLASLEYRVVGAQLRAFPESVTVPRNVPGSIRVAFAAGGNAVDGPIGDAGAGTRIEATLRGPSFPAQRLTAEYGEPLLLPPLRITGDYQLDDIQLVRGTNLVLQANPSSIPVHVFDEVLVSRVTSRPLTLEEIRDKGIAIDQSNFRVVEFDVTLVLRGRSFRVFMPVASPKARLSTELIPTAELEDRTVELERLNQELARSVQIPPEFAAEMPDFKINPINFEQVLDGDGEEKGGIPISGLLVIPGNIAFLNQFFSVQLFTENAAPSGAHLTVNNLRAGIRLPSGADGIPSRSYEQPGDDPLRMARIGPDKIIQTNLPVVLPGADNQIGTTDDITRLQPGETGSAEFLVEGLREGLHLLDIELEADLEGLAAGVTRVRGRAVGSVLVRNANFSMTFAHPQTVRTGEPYDASVTLLNTSDVFANLVSVSLNKLALSGVVLLSDEKVDLGNLAPGESATATFRLRSQRTGSVYFSNLTTSDDSVRGRLNLFMGVDERGVALSPDSIGYPDWVNTLPSELFIAANRVLGQALSIATAGRLPEGVRKLTSHVVERRVIQLAEAGQRLRYDDDPRRVFMDLALDWQGGRDFDPGFDQLLRVAEAGREWREAMAHLQESRDTGNAPQRLAALAPSLAGLGQPWWIASTDTSEIGLSVEILSTQAGAPAGGMAPSSTTATRSDISQSLAYRAARGTWLASRPDTNLVYTWRVPTPMASVEIGFLEIGADGSGELFAWTITQLGAGDTLVFRPVDGDDLILQRGTNTTRIAPTRNLVQEEAPRVVSVRQDISVISDRVYMRCPIREYGNWGTVLAVLFSKPMSPNTAEAAELYQFAEGNGARTVKLQPGGRVCLLQLHRGIGSFTARPREYELSMASLPDPRGNPSVPGIHPVRTTPAKGASLRGRVYGIDGNPVGGVPVTLTMEDRIGDKCITSEFRAGQVFTDDNGYFTLDFVLADVPFTLAAIDTSRMTDEDARTLLGVLLEAVGPNGADRTRIEDLTRDPDTRNAMLRAFNLGEIGQAIVAAEGLDRAVYHDTIPQGSGRDGSEIAVALRFRGRGSVTGRVLASNGSPIPGAAVNLFSDPDSRELGRGVFTGPDGSFAFHGVPLGEFSLNAETVEGRYRIVADRLLVTGETRNFDLTVPDQPERFGAIRGLVVEPDGTPHPGATVHVAQEIRGTFATGLIASTQADPEGYFRFPRIPATNWAVVAVSADGRRRGIRLNTRVAEGAEPNLLLALEATATLRGIVRYWDETPAPNAKVGGGDRVVRTDSNGRFELSGVPLGARTLVAGVDAPDSKDGVTRLGSHQLSVVPLGNDDVTIRLNAFGRIRGVVFDGSSTNRVPNVRVSIPSDSGFFWVNANSNGEYEFNGFGLGSYIVSAPAPPVKKGAEELAAEALEAIGQARSGGSPDEAAALVGQLANLYVQGSLGRLVTTDFTPGTWGFNNATLDFDGQTVVANINYLSGASLRGTVVNHQDVPIGADVTVRAFGPNKSGGPAFKEFGRFRSGLDNGLWSASGFLIGPYSVVARSPLLVGEARAEGLLTSQQPHLTNVIVKFPPQRDVTGRLIGVVVNPDGSPVTRADVAISFASDYVISTDTNGFFDTQIRLPASDYTITATNLDNALVGQSWIRIQGGITNFATVTLLGKGDLQVQVLDALGARAPGAQIRLLRVAFPTGDSADLTTDSAGAAHFGGLWEGDWQVSVERLAGVNKSLASSGTRVDRGVTNVLIVTLGPVATIAGRFVEDGSSRPIVGAQVMAMYQQAGGPVYGTAPTANDGSFEIVGLPVDSYVLVARNPVSGRLAIAEVRLNHAQEIRRVTLVERPLGEIHGTVLSGDGTQGIAGASVQYAGPDTYSPERSVTTDPSGAFRFSNVPVGPFRLTTREPALGLTGRATGELAQANSPLRVDLPVEGLGFAEIIVLEPDGVTPATNVTVRINGDRPFIGDTDATGRASFREIPLRRTQVTARSNRVGERNSSAQGELHLSRPGQTQHLTLQLSGVAMLSCVVRDSANQPAANAAISLSFESGGSAGTRREAVTAADGSFALQDLALGPWRLQATLGALAAFAGGTFTQAGEQTQLDLHLGSSGSLTGTVLRENGADLHDAEVAFFFTTQSGQPGFARAVTDFVGSFRANGLPITTPILVRVDVPALDGRVAVTTNLTTKGQVLDLGTLRLDQTSPRITDIQPVDGAIDLEPRPRITVTFSESMNLGSLRTEGLQLTQGTNMTEIDFVATNGPAGHNSQLIITPKANLRSARNYSLLILGADQVDAGGSPVSIGPEDLAGRPLPATVSTRFTVRDYEAPRVVNEFPTHNGAGIEPDAPIRFEFDEPIRTNLLQVVVRGPGGPIPGTPGFNASQRLVAWVPERRLDPNTRYQVELRGLTDLSGNVTPPRTNRFDTLDTLGPRITTLRLAPGQRPVANATVTLEALLERPEPGAVVRFARNGVDVGIATEGPTYRWPVRLPANGTVRLTAIGLDIGGNPGEVAVLELRVGPNDRPTLTLTRLEPPSGPLETGRRFSFAATARDDATVAALRLTARGALSLTREIFNLPNGTATNLLFELPADFVASGDIEFRVIALDDSGATSDEANLRFATLDTTAPTLALEAPIDHSILDPRQPLVLGLTVRDNSASAIAIVELSGVVSFTNRLDLALSPNAERQAPLSLSITNGLEGGEIRMTVRVQDAAGNRIEQQRAYTLRGVVGPRLRFAYAVDRGASWLIPTTDALSPWVSSVDFYFDRSLAALPGHTNLLQATNSLGIAIPFVSRISSSGVGIEWEGQALPPGASVTVRLLPGLTDANGNAAQQSDGSDIPPSGLEATFRVATYGGLDVTQGQPVVPGQTLLANLDHEPAFNGWQLLLNGVEQPLAYFALGSGFRVTVPTNATQVRLLARNAGGARPPIELPVVDLQIRSRNADDDNDGLPNGWEADHSWQSGVARFNPFDATDAELDWDFDQLDHRAEFVRGTDPFLADTDGDGLIDGRETSRGGCPDPFVFDSDGDGIRDGDDLAPCVAGEALTLSPVTLSVPEGASQTNTVVLTGVGLAPLSFAFSTEFPKPSFVDFADFSASGTNPIRRQLLIRPSFSDAGEYRLRFTATGRRTSTWITTNLELRLIVEDRANSRFTRWARAQDGRWNQPTNWSAGLPGIGTNAVIDLPGTYTVTLDTMAFTESLALGGSSGRQSLELGGFTLTLNDSSTVRSNAVVRMTASSRLNGQGVLQVDGLLTSENATIEGAGLLDIRPGGTLDFLGGVGSRFPTLSRPVRNSGMVRVSTNVTLILGGITVSNRPSGRWWIDSGNLRWGAGASRFDNEGELIKRGTNTSTVNFIDLDQRGTLRVEEGELSIESGSILFDVGSTNLGAGGLRFSSARGVVASRLNFDHGLIVNNTSLTNHVEQTWPHLTQANSSLGGPGDITVTRQWIAQGGTLEGTGTFRVAEGAQGLISSSLLLERTLESSGHLRLQTNCVVYFESANFLNRGTVEIPDIASFRWYSTYAGGNFENRGTLTKAGTGSLWMVGVGLRNHGRVEITGGTLDVYNVGENSGRIDVAAGTKVDFGAEMTHAATSWIGGAGSVEISGGTNDVRGELQPRGGFTVSGGTVTVHNSFDRPVDVTLSNGSLTFETSQEFQSLSLRAGELTGSQTITVRDTFDWPGGTLSGRAPLILDTNSLSRVQSGFLATTLDNRGRMEVEPNSYLRFDGGTLLNRGELSLIGAATFISQFPSTNLFRNDGLLRTGTNDVSFAGLPVELHGTHQLTPITFRLGPGTNFSRLIMPGGGRLQFEDDFTQSSDSSLGGDGTLEFNGGRHEVLGAFESRGDLLFASGDVHIRAPFTNTARTTLRGGTVTLEADTSLRDVTLDHGTLGAGSRLAITRSLAWNSALIEGRGSIRTEPTASIRINGFGDKRLATTFEAFGDVEFSNDSRLYLVGGTWTVPASVTNDFLGASQIRNVGNPPSGRLQILGSLRKSGTGTLDINVVLDNAGALLVDAGIVDLRGDTRFSGLTRITSGAELRFGSETNTWSGGARFEGSGTLRFPSFQSVLQLETPIDLGSLAAIFKNGTRIQGEFPLTSGAGGSISFRDGSFEIEGSLRVESQMTVAVNTVVRIDDELRLASSATLDNQGRRDGQDRSNVRVRAFPRLGGTVLGVLPDAVPGPAPLGFRPRPGDDPSNPSRLASPRLANPSGAEWVLTWEPGLPTPGPIEISEDLVHWRLLELDAENLARGYLAVPVGPAPDPGPASQRTLFFRQREMEW